MAVAEIVSIVGLIAVVGLVLVYLKLRQKDMLGAIMDKHRAQSRLVSRAEYVEGVEKIPVALALTNDTFYYENEDLQASFDLARIDEIEYDDEVATGKSLPDGCRVLRLRSHGAAFEFVLEKEDWAKWAAALPARSYGNQPVPQAV